MRKTKNSFLLRFMISLQFSAPGALAGQEKEPVKYIGPGSCAATSCHGSVKPIAGSRILQNEYSTWILQDKHSRAYQALTGEVGERMARILKLDAKAEESSKCLACHGLYTAPEQRGRAFAISEGVSCENWNVSYADQAKPKRARGSSRRTRLPRVQSGTRQELPRRGKSVACQPGNTNKFSE